MKLTSSVWLVIVAVTLKSSLAQEVTVNCSVFDIAPMDTLIARGSDSCLECTYSGSRLPRWQAVLTDMSFSAVTSTLQDECDCSTDDNGRLCFEDAGDEAVGLYRCLVQIENQPLQASCPFQIDLAVPPTVTVMEPVEQEVSTSETTTLVVPYNDGQPAGDVVWFKDGSPVTLGGRFSVGDNGALVINNVKATDRGRYNFTVSNIGGSDSRTVNLFVRFVTIDNADYTVGDDGRITVDCSAYGYPSIMVSLTDSTGGSQRMGDFQNMASAQTVIDNSANCQARYECTASLENGAISETQFVQPCGDAVVTITDVTSVNTSAVRVRWESTNADSYTIRYRVFGSIDYQFIEASSAVSEVIINGLIAGQTYEFAISEDGESYSAAMEATVDTCSASFSEPIRGVTARTVSRGNLQTIQLTWTASSEEVYGYRVEVDPCPDSVPCMQQVVGRTTTMYMFHPDICDGMRYSFYVQSINECGGSGPRSSLVLRTCDLRNRLTELKPNVDYVTIKWNFVDVPSALDVTAMSVEEEITLNYIDIEKSNSFNLETVCVQGLESETTYEVCLLPVFNNEGVNKYCDYVTTLSGNPTGGGIDCLMPTSTDTPPPSSSEPVFLNWHIAIIVVGALAIVAMVFCLVGLCFACQSSKQKVDFGSSSSLNTTYNTNSIRDGVSMQRSNSPSRSCLSYHIKGHSTNWSDHVDTLRQMETDGGTHV